MNSENKSQFPTFVWRITASHTISYFLMGITAATLLDYKNLFESEYLTCYMKSVDSVWVSAGPLLQVFRGLVFSLALWLIKDQFLYKNYGWLLLWGILVCFCVLTPTGPVPGSIEGFIYTKVPIDAQFKGYLEVIPQTLLFSIAVYYWNKKPSRWWNISSIILFVLICLMSFMAILVHFHVIPN